jgi:hypothetical protein
LSKALTVSGRSNASENEDSRAPDAGDNTFHKEALDRYDAAWKRDEENVLEGYADLLFLSGEQWDGDIKAARELDSRPVLTVNRLPQFVRQITGDIRQRRATAKVVPVDSRGDVETARIREGMHRYIENRSSAQAVYFQGVDQQVAAGRGAWRVTTEYASETTFEQEIRIEPIEDGLAVLVDPDALQPAKADADFIFVGVDLSIAKFKKKYPDAQVSDMGGGEVRAFQGWFGEDYVRVAEYFYKEPVKRTLLVGNGQVMDLTGAEPERLAAAHAAVAQAKAQGLPGDVRIEEREGFRVMRALISGAEVLEEPKPVPGPHIPIVVCDGEEMRIGRRIIRHGAVRHARDPQRMYNYYVSAQTETVALQPKAPWLGTERNFEEFQDEWERANLENRPYLRYTPDATNGNQAPQRVQPAVTSQGITEGLQIAAMDLQATTGIYNASLGAQSNETSGKAIRARQTEGDTGTFVYVEKAGQAIEHTHRIISGMIAHVYDTTRSMRIVGNDGDEQLVEVNKPAGIEEDGKADAAHDLTVDAYDIVFAMGPSYNTQRQEASEGMIAFLQAAPQITPLVIDLVAKMQDWPLADEIRERLESTLPPEIRAKIAEKNGEPPPEPPPPGPAEQVAMMEQEAAMATAKATAIKADAEVRKAELELRRVELEAQKLELEAATIEGQHSLTMAQQLEQQNAAELEAMTSHKAAEETRREVEVMEPSDIDRVVGLEQGIGGIPEATAVAVAQGIMPAFEALLEGMATLGGAIQQLTALASAETEVVRDPATNKVLGARKRLPAPETLN